MNTSTLFQAANSYVIIGWLLLLIAPTWKYTQKGVIIGIIALFAAAYSFLVLQGISNFNPNSFSTLEGVRQLFQNDTALLAGWLHYLAFDLFVGIYIVEEGQKWGISRWLISLALPLTFMFGSIRFSTHNILIIFCCYAI